MADAHAAPKRESDFITREISSVLRKEEPIGEKYCDVFAASHTKATICYIPGNDAASFLDDVFLITFLREDGKFTIYVDDDFDDQLDFYKGEDDAEFSLVNTLPQSEQLQRQDEFYHNIKKLRGYYRRHG